MQRSDRARARRAQTQLAEDAVQERGAQHEIAYARDPGAVDLVVIPLVTIAARVESPAEDCAPGALGDLLDGEPRGGARHEVGQHLGRGAEHEGHCIDKRASGRVGLC
eukprot:4107627-Prymnesium_polylepis.1